MTSTTFVHTSDLQLGMTRWFLDADAQGRFDDARLRAIDRLGEVAVEHGAAFIVVAGDVFEHNSLSERVTGRALERLRSLPVPVHLLPGNHDPLVADSIFYRTDGEEGVTVLADSEPVTVAPGVEIVAAPLLSKRATTDLVHQALEPLAPTDGIRILVGHGQAESRSNEITPDLIDLAALEARLADGTVDYAALGDTHSAQPVGDTGRVWYSGTPETTDFHEPRLGLQAGEHNSGNALVVTVSKSSATDATVEVAEVHVGEWTFEALDRELASKEDVEEFLSALDAFPNKDRTVIKYGLRGTLTMSATRRLETGLAERRPVFAALYERERLTDLHLEPGAEELAALGVSGFAAAALAELVDSAEADPTARDAVNLFFRLSKES
ncbi:metallophosphoesterase family protein [Corynebacterium comes]|uniref:Nuclease SbcCD subunit D n=1 Tax=Corynebacterium comes TaxID=2675218 RepID=A0A6B8VX81_9CORY|nr:exonuclease SbcCD subunit D [Corynebacterium comes]QGU04317.1 exonuclease subunit SbcD [Corynebacterium comes]